MFENRKRYSQNLLHSNKLVKEILDISNLSWKEKKLIIEIGPGKGIITKEILNRIDLSSKLITVEIDKDFLSYLNKDLVNFNNVDIINKDFLDYSLPSSRFTVISNLPFYCTSDVLRKILDPNGYMFEALLIVQKEAADMFIGKNGNTMKSLMYYPFWNFEELYSFNKIDFNPRPNINSVLIKVTRKEDYLIKDINNYFNFIQLISKDRVGEGVWKKMFSYKEMRVLIKDYGLIKNRGIAIQEPKAVLEAFGLYS